MFAMKEFVFRKQSPMPCSALKLFRWHESSDAFIKLLPPGEPVKIIHHDGHIGNGARAIILVGYWPLRIRWELEHSGYIDGEQFCDVQVKGPFKSWRHVHQTVSDGSSASLLVDQITFEMPFGFIGHAIGRFVVLPKLKRLFDYRHKITLSELSR